MAARRLAQPVLVGVWSTVLLTTFAAPWVVRVATTDYADDYAAYRTPGRLTDRAWRQVEVCGPGYVAAAAVGFLALLAARETRRAALVIGGMCPVMLAHFLRTQDLGTHHLYLFLPALVLLPSLALARAPAWLRWPGVACAVLAGAAAMVVTFDPAGLPYRDPLRAVVADVYMPPLTRDDLPELRRLLRAAGETDGDVAVVASSLTLNSTLFRAADRSLGEPLFDARRLPAEWEVDRRDGFPRAFVRADVLVVADPPQTHLDPAEQQGVAVTARSVWDGTDVGKAFDRLPGEYRLGDGVNVRLYRRARAIPEADLRDYCEKLRRAHPDRPAFFTPPPGIEADLAAPGLRDDER